MKITTNKITYTIAALFAVIVFIISSLWGGGVAKAYAATSTITAFEQSDVMEDLKTATINGKPFNTVNYPYDSTGIVKHPEILTVVEYCYSIRAAQREHYGVYIYFYNPQALNISTASAVNKIMLGVKYGTDKDGNVKVEDYEKFSLKFCSKSTGDYHDLFYKFKVIDHKSEIDGKTIEQRVNSNSRRYDISEIELLTVGDRNATAYGVGGTYTFTGYAKGYGADLNAESTLACSVKKLESVQLDVKHTFYRTETGSAVNHQNQINTVYFSVPKRLFNDYGKLQRIKAEWYEYVTKEILVTSNRDFYNAAKPYIGVDCSTKNDDLDYFLSSNLSYSSGMGNFWNCSAGWNLPKDIVCIAPGVSDTSIGKLDSLYYMFPTANWCSIEEYDPYSDDVKSSGGVSSNCLYEYIKSYNKSFENGTLPIKTQSISADLFKDDIDESRKMDNERGKIQKGYSYYDFDADLDLQSWQGWGDKEHSFWENSQMVGFWNALFGKVPEESGKIISPIQVIEKGSPLMNLSDTELVDELFINYSDISQFRETYDEAVTVRGKDDEEKVVVLFRFAVTDYFSENFEIVKGISYNKPLEGQAYVAQETVFFDFDVIQLMFNKNEEYTVIPCVSNPIDIVNAITTPPHIHGDGYDWLKLVQLVLGIIAAIIIFVLFYPVLSPILGALFKDLLWLITAPFKAIGKLFKRKKE